MVVWQMQMLASMFPQKAEIYLLLNFHSDRENNSWRKIAD